MSEPIQFDSANLMIEIEQEADRRRRSGELPPDFERELDRTFALFAPVAAVDADFDIVLAKIERDAVIDTNAPTLSARPGVATMKQVVSKASGFYLRHIASQVSVLVQSVARALRLLGDRTDALEREVHAGRARNWRQLEGGHEPATGAPVDEWSELVVRTMTDVIGRVLHTEAGTGSLVARLLGAGIDAYGVEPVEELALVASDLAPDIRADPALTHLETLPPNSLGGVVLSGLVETLPAGELMDMVDTVVSCLSPGGSVVIISTHPRVWADRVSPITADLADGRPLHPETWQAILAARRFSSIEIHRGGEHPTLRLVDGEGPMIETINDNVAQLNTKLFGPPAYAITAISAH